MKKNDISFIRTRVLLIVFACLLYNNAKSQAISGIVVSKGMTVSFFFNNTVSFSTGITYTDFTIIKAYNDGTDIDGLTWDMSVQVLSNPYGFPVDRIRIRAEIPEPQRTDAFGGAGHPNGIWHTLGGVTQLVTNGLVYTNDGGCGLGVAGDPACEIPINISYEVGGAVSVSGTPDGYYPVTLQFDVVFY